MKINQYKFFLGVVCGLLGLLLLGGGCSNQNNTISQTKIGEQKNLPTINQYRDSLRKDTLKTGKVYKKISCISSPTQTYALYIPKSKKMAQLPIVYFFDPHGDGVLPVKKYKALADQFQCILVGSNNSKNGNNFKQAEHIWETLYYDTKERLSFDENRIFVIGFSGGAKVATFLGLKNPQITGVAAGGAVLSSISTLRNLPFNYIQISGMGNLNLTQMLQVHHALGKGGDKNSMLFFEGVHSWSPVTTMKIAVEGLFISARGKSSKNTRGIDKFIKDCKDRIVALKNKGENIRASNICNFSAVHLDNYPLHRSWFIKENQKIKKTAAYKKEKEIQQKLLQKERQIKEDYRKHFRLGTQKYWEYNIEKIKKEAKKTSVEQAMYQRLSAYLSLAFYSLSHRLIQKKDYQGARFFDDLYKNIDPTNTEAWYFSALINANQNQFNATKMDLKKAIQLGFKDSNRIQKEHLFFKPEIQSFLPTILSEIKEEN